MVLASVHRFIISRVFVLLIIVVEWRVFSFEAERIRRKVESSPKTIQLSRVIGESARMTYKSKDLDFDSALKSSYWKKDTSNISRTDRISLGINRNKTKFWLEIKKVDVHDSGTYSFVVNGTVLRWWLLHIKEEPCGVPLQEKATSCVPFSKLSHPDCPSFPGKPLNVRVSYHLYEGMPIVQVTWTPPNTGFGDLWGYQLYITGKGGHPGHNDCAQINRKKEILHWTFHKNIRYGATYQITVQSMPSHHKNDNNLVHLSVRVPEKCQFKQYMNLLECSCSFINVTAKYTDHKILLEWALPLKDKCQSINKTFTIRWNNIQIPQECTGEEEVKEGYEFIIQLERDKCTRFNYSIKLSGKINEVPIKDVRVTVLIPKVPTQGLQKYW